MKMNDVYIALGSNIEPRLNFLKRAISLLEGRSDIEVIDKSKVYVTKPVGYTEQADFLNQVIFAKTTLNPFELLHVCQSIEKELGRERNIRFGPRTIDLDILLFNNEKVQTNELTIPHPRMKERAFVLVPLYELSKEVKIDGYTVEQLLKELPEDDLRGVEVYNS